MADTAIAPLPSSLGLPGMHLSHCADWVTLAFETPHRVLSSAVLGGGISHSQRWLNLRVSGAAVHESPQTTLATLCRRQGWEANTVAMMTAASMASLRVRHTTLGKETLMVLVTAGLSNARRAGDPAEYRLLCSGPPPEPGTINLALVTSIPLSDAALVESALVATEAKAALLQELGIRSPVSGAIATGTGTDAIAVFAGQGPVAVHYAGKHTLFGEAVARLVLSALADAIRQSGPLIDDIHIGEPR
ncbi:MAG: adenosylcobinamide amidohydrolase [Bacteroidales bacterium]|nr:adenosylcobinamide amidohydrolase [Bacteroidales bacterium]